MARERKRPVLADLATLKEVKALVPDARFTKKQKEFLANWGPKIGWKNLMNLILERETPEQMKMV